MFAILSEVCQYKIKRKSMTSQRWEWIQSRSGSKIVNNIDVKMEGLHGALSPGISVELH